MFYNKINYNIYQFLIYSILYMDKLIPTLGLFCVTLISGLIYVKYDEIKIKVMTKYSNIKARQITIEFFESLLEKNPDITLDEAILKFEDVNNEFNSLEEYSKKRHRSVEIYRESYYKLFDKAKRNKRIF